MGVGGAGGGKGRQSLSSAVGGGTMGQVTPDNLTLLPRGGQGCPHFLGRLALSRCPCTPGVGRDGAGVGGTQPLLPVRLGQRGPEPANPLSCEQCEVMNPGERGTERHKDLFFLPKLVTLPEAVVTSQLRPRG